MDRQEMIDKIVDAHLADWEEAEKPELIQELESNLRFELTEFRTDEELEDELKEIEDLSTGEDIEMSDN